MSQWNNSYSYNQQHQGSGTWNGELSNQYTNQPYVPTSQPTYEPSNQYVNFQEFLSQMQSSSAGASGSGTYNNAQYPNYSNNQYEYPTIPSTSQNASYFSANSNVVNGAEGIQTTAQSQNRGASATNYDNHMVFKSNLTPTATEFVPKGLPAHQNSGAQNSNSLHVTATYNGVSETKNKHMGKGNWREKQSSQPSSSRSYNENKNEQESGGKTEKDHPSSSQSSNESKNDQDSKKKPEKDRRRRNNNLSSQKESSNKGHEHGGLNEAEGGDYESNDYSHDSNKHSTEYNNRSYEPHSRKYEANSRSSRKNESSRSFESNNQSNDPGYKNSESVRNDCNDQSRNNDFDSRQYETGNRNNDNSGRNFDSRRRNCDSNNRHYEGNSRNYDSSSANRNSDYNRRTDFNGRDSDYNSRNNDYNGRNQDYSSRNNDYNGRNYDSSNRNYDNRGQGKNSKSKNKEADNRTFYNSSVNKSSQDVRSGRGERGESSGRTKNWAGSQRVRPSERADDEQFAKGYLDHREDNRYSKGSRSEATFSPLRSRNKQVDQSNTDMTQRERLSEQLDKGALECLVCCERVRQTDSVWSCGNCYHVLHLRCIRKWALSSVIEGKWRCPACQNTSDEIPTEYRCMCGAVRSPEYQRGASGAHTCGQACQRARSCPHPCTLPCHPGPCPPCQATVSRKCGCGAETRSILCSSKLAQVCGRVCSRVLLCGVHACARACHEGACDECAETVDQVCYCPLAQRRSVACGSAGARAGAWSCGAACARVLACGAHVCRRACHAPPCAPCLLLPARVLSCPCGRTRLDIDARKSCTDPVPLCGNICAKPLECGPAGDKHFCKLDCHEGACPACPEKTLLPCRCGHSSREVPCADLPDMLDNVFCQKKCNKKLSCGRHRCRAACCNAATHRCGVVCGRMLACQLHRCDQFCHTGHCAPCTRASFEELTCECGAEVILPPVPCGAKRPACSAPCRRPRPCSHPPHHSCHQGECPPCVVLTTKRCHGQHEERKTIPCSQEEFSCGLPCGKPLPCGKHTCQKTCHKGPCDTGKCTQPCNEKRPSCGHPCAAPCHAGASSAAAASCPSAAPCRRAVRATCPCGRRAAERACHDNAKDHAKIMSALAASKIQEAGSVDLHEVHRPSAMLKTLECDDECRVEARTRRLALALQIRNPDVSAKLAPRYSEHVRATAAREPAFAGAVHQALTDLVQRAKKSKQKTRAHSFASMNWQKRQFIHELCEQFGCESVAYDAEPNRNVVATADREKSWLPALSVLELLARETGKRRVPPPVLRAPPAPAAAAKPASGWATLTSTNAWAARAQKKPEEPAPPKIDYFDNPPDN